MTWADYALLTAANLACLGAGLWLYSQYLKHCTKDNDE